MDTSLSLEFSQRLDFRTMQTLEFITLPYDKIEEKIQNEAKDNPVIKIVRNKRPSYGSTTYSESGGNKEKYLENISGSGETLNEHLLSSLGCLRLDENIKEGCEIIISSLNRYGFIEVDINTILPERLREYAPNCLKVIQSLDPIGVGAKDWRESLLIQLEEIEKNESEIELYKKLLYEDSKYTENKDYKTLSKLLKISEKDVETMLSVLKSLNPYPGLMYNNDVNEYITPEVSIKVIENEVKVKLLYQFSSSIEVDSSYEEMASSLKGKKNDEEKEALKYLKSNINKAENLKRLLELRDSTLEKLALYIADKQKDFFFTGPVALHSLTMSDTSKDLNVNVSTISKIAAEKYVDTDYGILPLRSFFSTGLNSDGEDLSREAIKIKIQKLINENKSGKKLSDQKISDALKEEGIEIARRTVSKYRAEIKEGK